MSGHESPIVYYVSGVIIFLSISIFSFLGARKIKLPYSIILVIIGAFLYSFKDRFEVLSHINLTPDVLLFIFLPLLLFESAFNIDFHKFKKDLNLVTILASVGVIISAFFIAILTSVLLNIDFGISLFFGMIIACTDPIAVISIFKELGVPKRLMQLVDGESMLNDGTAVVFSKIILSILTVGFASSEILLGIGNLAWTISASLIIGISLGKIVSKLVKYTKEQMLIEITLTILLALSTFILSEVVFHASGIIAVVAAGMTFSISGKDNFSPKVKNLAVEIWEYIAFISNSLVFLLVGLTYGADKLIANWKEIIVIYLIVKAGRALAVYVIGKFYNKTHKETQLPESWLHILNWGGLRGALPIAVIASLENTENIDKVFNTFTIEDLLSITIGVVLLSLIINGTTIKYLIKKLNVDEPTLTEKIHSDLVKILLLDQSLEHIKNLREDGEISADIQKSISSEQNQEKKCLLKKLRKTTKEESLEVKKVLYYHAFQIEKETFTKLYEKNLISEKVFSQLKEKLAEGISLIEEGVLPKEFSKNKVLLTLSKKFKKDFTLEELYNYRKARQIANIEVLKKLRPLKKIKALEKPLNEVINIYVKFAEKNKKMCNDLASKDTERIKKYEKDFCYKEFIASEETFFEEMKSSDKINAATTKIIKESII